MMSDIKQFEVAQADRAGWEEKHLPQGHIIFHDEPTYALGRSFYLIKTRPATTEEIEQMIHEKVKAKKAELIQEKPNLVPEPEDNMPPIDVEKYTIEDLDRMTKAELRSVADAENINYNPKANKETIFSAIAEHYGLVIVPE